MNQVTVGYEIYREVVYYENPYYDLSIIQGINNDDMTYGLYFYNHKPSVDPHQIIITTNGKDYLLKTNSRKDIFAPAIKLNEDVEINIYDSNGRKRGNSIFVNAVDEAEFRNIFTDYHEGENMGIELSKLSRKLPALSFQGLLLIVFGGIILIFGFIILILFITKKGMFNEKKKAENVFNFREFAQTLYEKAEKENEIILREDEYIESQTPVYERQRDYEEEEVIIDVTKILQEKGFNTNYKLLTEAEKNEIMLELMLLRDLKDITSEQYRQEVIKLWSK